MGSSSKMPAAPASPFTGTGQANEQALGGMTQMQNAPNYAMQQYQSFAPGMAGAMAPTNYNPQSTVDAGNYMSQQGQGMYGQGQQLMNMGLDPQQEFYNRAFQQSQEQGRAGQSARGLLTSPIGAQMEQQGNQQFNELWRNQQAGRAAQMAGAAQGMYGAGAQSMMGGQAMAGAVPGTQLGWGQGLQGMAQQGYALPQQNIQNWINYLNQGAQSQNQAYQNQLNAYNTKAGQDAQSGQQTGQAIGTAAMMAMMMMSDRRMKRDVTRISEFPDGTPIYTFRYKHAPETYIGVMAQDIIHTHPGAVHDIGGVLHVDYAALLGGM